MLYFLFFIKSKRNQNLQMYKNELLKCRHNKPKTHNDELHYLKFSSESLTLINDFI